MANEWSISDKGEQLSPLQSIVYQEDLDVLVAGAGLREVVLSGGVVSAQGSPDLTVAVSKAATISGGGNVHATAAGNGTIGAADATLNRFDLVVINSAAAIAVRAGTPAAYPRPPVRTAGDVVLARVFVPPLCSQIKAENITPLRMVLDRNITIYRTTAARTIDTSTAANSIWATPPVLPSGLFLAGKILRVRAGGNMLINSGTPTLRLEILYGGSTMFSFISVAAVADADRCAWMLDFDLTAQGNSDQALAGTFELNDLVAARPTPTAGVGNWQTNTATAEGPCAIGGSAAVDSDAADRTLDVRFTFNVSNAADQFVCEHSTVELV